MTYKVPYSIRRADPRVRPLPGSETPSPSTLTPSPSTEEGWGEGDSSPSPVGAGLKPALPGAAWEPCNPESIVPAQIAVVPAKAEPAPHPIRGQRSGDSAVPGPAASEADLTVVPAESLSHTRYGAGTQGGGGVAEDKDEKPAPVELTPAERRIEQKLETHRHEPDPWDGPIDPTNPGRSPPC